MQTQMHNFSLIRAQMQTQMHNFSLIRAQMERKADEHSKKP
jgi:hypothetical protein